MTFLALKIKTSVFFSGEPIRFFHHSFFGYFYGWLQFFMSPTFFTLTAFQLLFCQVLSFCVVVLWVPQIPESFFYPQAVFSLHSFLTFGTTGTCTNLISRVLWEPTVLPWSCRGLSTVLRNTYSAHLFVYITQCSAKGVTW